MAAVSALGRGAHAQLAGGLAGAAAFAPVRRFDVGPRRVTVAATLPDAGTLGDELAGVVREACAQAGLSPAQRAATPLLLAVHGHPTAGRESEVDGRPTAAAFAAELAALTGLAGAARVYTCACVSASTAVADAAALDAAGAGRPGGRGRRVPGGARPVRALRRRPGAGDRRRGPAVQRRTRRSAARRRRLRGGAGGRRPRAPRRGGRLGSCRRRLPRRATRTPRAPGWPGRSPPRCAGPASPRTRSATSTPTRAARRATPRRRPRCAGPSATRRPGSRSAPPSPCTATALEALRAARAGRHRAGAAQAGKLPVNAGYLGADPACALDVITGAPREAASPYALSLNAAFGGANTALLVSAA